MSASNGLLSATNSSLASVKKLPDSQSAASTFSFQHIPELDGFRGLAVLVVVVGHYFEYRLPGLSKQFATVDKLGVLLFFVLSMRAYSRRCATVAPNIVQRSLFW